MASGKFRTTLTDIAEYFVGLQTHQAFRQERDFYKEKVENPKHLNSLLRISIREERVCLFYGKILPNLLDASAIIHSLINRGFPYGIVLGEVLRGFCIISPIRHAHAKIESRIQTICII